MGNPTRNNRGTETTAVDPQCDRQSARWDVRPSDQGPPALGWRGGRMRSHPFCILPIGTRRRVDQYPEHARSERSSPSTSPRHGAKRRGLPYWDVSLLMRAVAEAYRY